MRSDIVAATVGIANGDRCGIFVRPTRYARRQRLAHQRLRQNLVNHADRNDLQPFLHIVRNFSQILLIFLWNQHCLQASAEGRKKFLLETTDRKNPPSECNFTRHGDVTTHLDASHGRHDRSDHGDARRRPVFRCGPLRNVDMKVGLCEFIKIDP